MSLKTEPSLEEHEALILIIFGFGLCSVLMALLYKAIRHRVFADADSLDQSFDAGGKVSTSLTSVTIAVQLLWPADLLQSATVTSKYGISGGFWYSISIIINIMLFPLLSLHFKTRAPGAKTFLQLIKARFGARTHLLYCVFALMTNAIVTATLVVAGTALFQAVVKDISVEMVVMLMAALFGSYSFVGGLGSTFYVSYFNAVITLCVLSYMVAKIFYMPDDQLPFGNFTEIHERVANLIGPEDNEDRSFLTFWSAGSMVWAAQGTFICLAIIFCDQASWQSKIAAKPMQGVLGFFFASFIWFAIPSTLGTSAGLAYLSYTSNDGTGCDTGPTPTENFLHNGSDLQLNMENMSLSVGVAETLLGKECLTLSMEDVNRGLVTPFVTNLALGRHGAAALLIMFTMLMMSTGSGEVMAVASIIVYDIYQSYIRPFRVDNVKGHCILCGRPELGEKTDIVLLEQADNFCCCPSTESCEHCAVDKELIASGFENNQKGMVTVVYTCPYHGQYRAYEDSLVELRNWVVLWISISIIPIGLIVISSGVDLNWIFMNGAMTIVQAFPGIILSILWVKATGTGLVVGSLTGLVAGLAASFSRAATLEGGLSNFLENTADGYAVLAGSGTCLFVSLIVSIMVSLATHNINSPDDAEREWQKLRDIDNPLRPWQDTIREGGLTPVGGKRPTYQQLDKHYRMAKYTTYVGSVVMVAIFVFMIPGCMASFHKLTSSQFQSWLMTLHIWCFVTSAIVVVLTPVEEIRSIVSTVREKMARKKTAPGDKENDGNSNDVTGERVEQEKLVVKKDGIANGNHEVA